MSLLYVPENLRCPAYQLRFSWTCWPTDTFPAIAPASIFSDVDAFWEEDGIRRLETRWTSEMIQLTVSVKPHVTPVFLTGRLKGRLDHAARKAGAPLKFSRKVSLRSLGNTRRDVIEAYIQEQVPKQRFVDPQTVERLARFTYVDSDVNLALASPSRSGRYWYNLHIVLLLSQHEPVFDEWHLQAISNQSILTADANGYKISRQTPMPDHLHLALRGNIEHSPEQIALQFLNQLANAVGHRPIWENCYYAGTFGEYDMGAVRLNSSCST